MILYLVRHGQSFANLGQSVPDAHLTPLGLLQAQRLGKSLAKTPLDRVYGSTLARAAQTAAAVAAQQNNPALTLELLPELVETGTPEDFVGDRPFLESLYGNVRLKRDRMLSFPTDAARAAYVLEQSVYRPAWEEGFDEETVDGDGHIVRSRNLRVLMASHGVCMAHLIAQLVGFPFDPNMIVSLHNACVCQFSFFTVDGVRRIRFISHNDTRHLRKDMLT